jgi:1,4-alpha-glucan branching enzyme
MCVADYRVVFNPLRHAGHRSNPAPARVIRNRHARLSASHHRSHADGRRSSPTRHIPGLAPHAHSVHVVGSFNGFTRREEALLVRQSDGYWQGFLRGVNEGDTTIPHHR